MKTVGDGGRGGGPGFKLRVGGRGSESKWGRGGSTKWLGVLPAAACCCVLLCCGHCAAAVVSDRALKALALALNVH